MFFILLISLIRYITRLYVTRDYCVLTGGYIAAPGSFLFSLRNNDDLPPFKAPLKNDQNALYAIYRTSGYGPTFGAGHDLRISSSSYADFGHTYQSPSGYIYGGSKTQSLLAGSKKFIPAEVEVLYLI